jgi:uncharacterized repeat protein (TIGR01451 family)
MWQLGYDVWSFRIMKRKIGTSENVAQDKWFRLGCSIGLAFFLALVLLLIPVTTQMTLTIPMPGLPRMDLTGEALPQWAMVAGSSSSGHYSDGALTLSLPFGAEPVRATGGLTITKFANSPTVDQGGLLSYTLVITNQTGFALDGVIIVTDTVPANTSCYSIPGSSDGRWFSSQVRCDEGIATWVFPGGYFFGVFSNDTAVELVYTVLVDEPLPNQSQIENAAFSYGVSAPGYSDQGTVSVTTTVNAPEWQISKSVTPTPTVQAGDYLTYTLTATNMGASSTDGNFYVVDNIPDNVAFYSATGNYVQSGDLITWTISTPLEPGESTTTTFVAQVDSPLVNGLTITNTDFQVFGGKVLTDALGSPVVSIVRSQAQLEANKTADRLTVEAGDLITYTLTVTNLTTASGPAEGVTVADHLPSEVLYEDMGFVSPAAGTIQHPPMGSTGVLTWTLGDSVQPGDSAQVYLVGRVSSPLVNGTPFTNTCVVSGTNVLAPATCTPLVNTATSTPSLSLGKSVTPSANVPPGGTVTYTLIISNTGNETATGVVVTDDLGSAFSPPLRTWTDVSVPGRPTYATAGTQTLVFTAAVPLVPGTYYNTAITATYVGGEVTAENLAPISVGSPDLHIQKSVAPGAVLSGDVLTYTIVYSNASSASATGVWITDTLGANLVLVDASPWPDVQSPPQFVWDVGSLDQTDGEQTITIVARVAPTTPNGTLVSNSVFMTSTQGAGASDGPVSATVLAPELDILKSDAGYDPIDAGAVLTYTITYSNTGDADAHNVRITDTLDANVSFAWASMTPHPSSVPPDYVWSIGDLPAHSGPQILTVAVNVAQPLAQGTELVNDVVIGGDEPYVDSAGITTTVRSTPVFQVSKAAAPEPATPGQPLTYTIVFTNVGNAAATGVRITDTLDGNVVLQDSDPPYSGVVGNQVYWDWPSSVILEDPQTIRVSLLVASPLEDGTLLWNTVELDSTQGATGTVTVSTPVQSTPDLHITKSATPSVVQPGEMITYTIAFSNTGTASADVVITDTLDPNVSFVSATPPPTGSPPPYIWAVAGLSPLSGTQVITLVAQSASVLEDGAFLINNVTIAGDGSGDSDTASTSIQSLDLSIKKSALPTGDVRAAEWITYTITFSNTGGMDATGVLVTDTLPISLTNVVSSTSSGIDFVGGAPPYVWRDSHVAGGGLEVGVITITGQLVPSPWSAAGAELANVVTIRGDQTEAITGNNIFTVTNLGVPGNPYTVSVIPAVPETTVGTGVLISVTATDRFGNPVRDGTAVNFSSWPVGSSVVPATVATSGGLSSATLNSVVSATVTITATAGGATDSAGVTFRPGPLHHFAVDVTNPQKAGITFTTVITALDQYGNLVDFDGTVTLADTTGTLALTGSPALANGRGTVSTTVYTAISTDMITATWGVTPIIGLSAPFEVLPGDPDSLTVTAYPTTMRVCQTATVTTSIADQWGNPVPDQWVDLTLLPLPSPGGSANLSPLSGDTGPTAILTSTLQATGAGNVRLYGERSGGTPNNWGDMPTITINDPPVPTSLNLDVAPNPLYIGGVTGVVTATVSDCFGVSPGQTITFTLSDVSLAWFPGPSDTYIATTDASGVATATLTSNSASLIGTLTITGTVEDLVDVVTLNVDPAPTPSLTITKTAYPSGGNVRPGQVLNYTLVAHNTGGAEATGVVISDTLPAGLGLVSASAAGANISSYAPLNAVSEILPAGQAITVSLHMTVTAEISGTRLNNQASVDSNETDIVFSSLVSHRVISNTRGIVFLPIASKNQGGTTPPTPTDANLRIIDIGFVGGAVPSQDQTYHVYVVVGNTGTQAVTEDFWVDLYLNPVTTPQLNHPWQNLSQSGTQGVSQCPGDPTCYGRAWQVTSDLAPNAVITLTTQMPVDQRYDRWPADGAPYAGRHSPIMALVDSWGTTSYGAVYENNETDNLSGAISGAGWVGNQAVPKTHLVPAMPIGDRRPSLPAW